MKAEPRGFTLVELLAVIAIVGILAGILIPVVRTARASANKSTCLSNLRQIGAALNLFVADNNGHFPYGYYVPNAVNSSQPKVTWDIQISGYLGRPITGGVPGEYPVLTCPADTDPATTNGRARRSYSMVRGSDGFGVTTNAVAGVSSPALGILRINVPDPGRTLIIAEYSQSVSSGGSDNQVGSPACCVIDNPQVEVDRGNGVSLHAGRFDYLFVDGHVENLLPEAMIGTGSMTSPKGMWTIAAGD